MAITVTPIRKARAAVAGACMAIGLLGAAHAGEPEIRKNLADRLPDLGKIDEVRKAAMAGLYEVRVGTELYYSDENGNYFIEGHLVDTKTGANLTEERIAKLTAIDFSTLPLKDAMVWKQGDGSRKLVVFADPNCGYCKKLEREIRQVKDITIYTFLLPILGADSTEKSRNIWCSKDPARTWIDWMVDGKLPPRTMGDCDASVLQRNTAMGRKYKVNGTPALVFEDGKRIAGAPGMEQLEKTLVAAKKPS
jgi:thiol:disulfide interchange protein DsbC